VRLKEIEVVCSRPHNEQKELETNEKTFFERRECTHAWGRGSGAE